MKSQHPLLIAPSLLAANLLDLNTELLSAEANGADLHHVDVMDGHFVPNLSFGLPVVEALSKVANIPLDVHLMITNPDHMAMEYTKVGAHRLSFHIEASLHPHRLLRAIRSAGVSPGLAINPGTSIASLEPLIDEVDFINLMSVNPGFSGQSFIKESVSRISELSALIQKRHSTAVIEVDGGVQEQNAKSLVDAGASILVVGNYFYRSSQRNRCISILRQSVA
jgi:ribulose-phosphate 3-epimerase